MEPSIRKTSCDWDFSAGSAALPFREVIFTKVVFKNEGEVFKTLHPVFGETVVLVAEVFKTNRLR